MVKLCRRILLLCIPLHFAWGEDLRLRTGLDLSRDKAFSFPGGFTMSFDILFCSGRVHPFGSVFRIVTDGRRFTRRFFPPTGFIQSWNCRKCR
jgi:hypothetical protein